jgi:hypothetical protein
MATQHPTDPHPAPVQESYMDYAQHEKTYSGFVTGVKWVVYGLAAFMVVLYFIVQP